MEYFARHTRPLLSVVGLTLLVLYVVGGCAQSGLEGTDAGRDGDASSPPVDTSLEDTAVDADAPAVDVPDTEIVPKDTSRDSTSSDTEPPPEETGVDADAGSCGGCGAGEICQGGKCVDACGSQGADCGTVMAGGTQVDCGSCSDGDFCSNNACRSICDASGAECGEVFWGGKTAKCGSCSGDCFRNRCVSSGFRSITGGYRHSCATNDAGELFCWGSDFNGQLGNGSDGGSQTPVNLSISDSALEVRSTRLHSCALLGSGALLCWGSNNKGQIGDGSTNQVVESPATVSQISRAVDVSAGTRHSCATTDGLEAKCWGSQAFGRLGNSQNAPGARRTPVDVNNITDAVEIVAAGSHSCALKTDGTVQCWGNGSEGRLGNGVFSGSPTPTDVLDLKGVVDIGAGIKHTCAVRKDGTVWCWGFGGDFQLGHGASSNEPVPVQVQQLSGAVAVAAGESHTCARTKGGEVYCWGSNVVKDSDGNITAGGQLGDGSFQDSKTPVAVTNPGGSGTLTDIVELGAGRRHSCGVSLSGDAYCWGANNDGQLGDGTTDNRNEPVKVE